MKRYFTSDWHLNDSRIGINGKPNLFYRNFDSIGHQNKIIIDNFLENVKDGDELIHLGDVIFSKENSECGHLYDAVEYRLKTFKELRPNSKFTLIIGNYDEDKLDLLGTLFDEMVHEKTIDIKGKEYYLNHYPVNCIDKGFSLTGHIHGLWKVQKNMINVGVDAWHFKPVSEDEIDFCRTACEKYYDKNVFPY